MAPGRGDPVAASWAKGSVSGFQGSSHAESGSGEGTGVRRIAGDKAGWTLEEYLVASKAVKQRGRD